MGDWGLKVSLPGKDISSTTPEDFVFNSQNQNNIKIVARLGSTVTINASSSTDVSVTHGLGFIPMVILYYEPTPGSGNWHMACTLYEDGDTVIEGDGTFTYVDDTYFKFRISNKTGAQKVVSFYFFIFGDSAN